MRLWNLDILLALLIIPCSMLIPHSVGFSLQYRGNTKHPTLPDHCYYDELQLAVPLNDTVFPVNESYFCAKVYCREDYVLMIKHCDRMQLRNDCQFTPYNYTLPYPDCCAQLVCPN
ncbi:uncharacterized protein LOC117794268 [Drosophila innubila]|uniref:uncharacterized protein LOC117794268 n=1 Tax=Drosophila innubila TaxID=198719 RepID=UPI00148CF1AA|nr:uncharacterized protein LOC117794268 [Drosophila innubila]